MPSKKSKSNPNNNASFSKRQKTVRTKILCRQCQAVYDGKGWIAFKKMDPKMVDQLKMGICPACHEENDHMSDGILHIRGMGVAAHQKEIVNHINKMGKQAEEKNIEDRVERVDQGRGEITVYTTLNQLAVRIGKGVASSYKGGKLDIKWSREDKPVEVFWTYDKVKK